MVLCAQVRFIVVVFCSCHIQSLHLTAGSCAGAQAFYWQEMIEWCRNRGQDVTRGRGVAQLSIQQQAVMGPRYSIPPLSHRDECTRKTLQIEQQAMSTCTMHSTFKVRELTVKSLQF
jgi:hypothetical protein